MAKNRLEKVAKAGTQFELPVGTPRRRAKDGSWRGGRRKGAGRKPGGGRARVSHARRPLHKAAHPLHISMKAMADVPNLRQPHLVRLITRAMRQVHACQSDGAGSKVFRVVEFSIQATHLHLVAEAQDRRAMSRGMASLAIRIARGLNGAVKRKGKVWADRYYARCLTVPKKVRNALVYVLLNSTKHNPNRLAAGRQQTATRVLIDANCTSARWFNGFSSQFAEEFGQAVSRALPLVLPRRERDMTPVADATTWLLTTGWRRHGLIHPGRDAPKR